ncbi:plasminogen activator inhibitor 1 RNA-binding protein [Teleopsis dalmanni]|uniref:plasminogen activator inhibitor 1 RNA-binding protein n=1 Tax=Teleopsis dalmanni TaxID=139649 RepID=UPI0018CF9FCA|nr:plasminogen activator inhibitor 1 RNA-binding protein [Teleopsis dalmanni]XP_037957879.1 plasminogen activator inhibitor 1 RNA-binding protein [Teleopsis dalmanni]
MDLSGTNRYELLFMDDDISDPLDNTVVKNKKQVKNANSGGGSNGAGVTPKSTNKQNTDASSRAQPNKKLTNFEKENKSLTLNKNENKKVSSGNGAINEKQKQQGGVATATVGGTNTGNRKRNNAIPRENGNQGPVNTIRNNRRNFKENGFNNATGGDDSTQQIRQFRTDRDRENRGPPRTRNFEGGNRNGKREFDRQSGSDKTGIKAINKRDGAGAHNWGSVKEAIDDVNKNDVEATGTGVEKSDEILTEQADTTLVEEETKELTLDEWKAQKQQRVKPTFNIRKAGEGEDTSQWKKMIVLNNNKRKENESEEELEFDPAMYPQRVGRQQRVLDIQFNFNDGRRGGGGFGGRGRGRGPRPGNSNLNSASGANIEKPNVRGFEGNYRGAAGRGGKRHFVSDRQQQNAAPKVNDERQFPTLA